MNLQSLLLARIIMVVCLLLLALTRSTSSAQPQQQDQYYDDYGGDQQPADTLYHDYAARHEAGGVAPAGGGGWARVALGTAAGWFVGGKFHTRRLRKKLNAKFKEEQKQLYTDYYNDVYALQKQNAELMAALEQYAGHGARRA